MKYDFEFSWASTYGYAAKLVAQFCERGVVVDLGCGAGSFAKPLDELGFEYVGFEHDPDALALCRERNVPAEPIDLTDIDDAIERVRSAIGDAPVRAVTLLDVIEHLVDPDRVLSDLRRLVDALSADGAGPVVVVSIPNVAHADLGAKLVVGRWDVVDVGLLDDTHVTLFTEERMRRLFDEQGFVEVGANDTVIPVTEQQFPVDHPAVAPATPMSSYLRSLRRRANATGDTYQFVRCFRPIEAASTDRPGADADDGGTPFLTAVVRTGPGLSDLLTCLAAQRDRDLDVIVVAEAGDPSSSATTTVDAFAGPFRITVVEAPSGARLLDEGIGRATGRYVALLDSTALLTGDWSATIRATADAAPGTTIRMRSADQPARTDGGPVVTTDGFRAEPRPAFDLVEQLSACDTRATDLVVPGEAIRSMGLRFDASLSGRAAEWHYVVRAASETGVTDVPTLHVIRRIADDAGSDADAEAVRREVLAALDADQFLLPAGAMSSWSAVHEARSERDAAEDRYRHAMARIDALERSRYWTVTAPLRRLTSSRRLRRLLGRGAP